MALVARLPAGPLASAARAPQSVRSVWAAPHPAAAAARLAAAQPQRRRRQAQLAWAATPDAGSPSSSEEDSSEGGLLPEEDAEIPGGWMDAMSSNTALGKAVKGACDELDTLGSLERQTLEEAEDLLKKLGFKGSLFTPPPQAEADEADEQQGSGGGEQ